MTPFILDKSPVCQDQTHSNFSSDSRKINPHCNKLECPRFDGSDFFGWKLKVKQSFKAIDLVEEEKVAIVMIHLDGKALQWHQRFMKS